MSDMRSSFWIILVVVFVLIAAGVGLAYWFNAPRLVAIWPEEGAAALPAGAEIRLTFSQSMQPDTVIQRIEFQPERPGAFTWEENKGKPNRTLVFTPQQPWEAGTLIQVQLKSGAKSAGAFSSAMRQGKAWSFRIRQPELAYLYPSTGSANIYLLNPLSGISTAVTQNMGNVQDFSVNASGAAIFYSSRTGPDTSALFRLDLAVSNAASTVKTPTATPAPPPSTQLLICAKALCRAAAISPDSKYLAYERTAFSSTGQNSIPQVWVLALASLQEGSQAETFLAGDPLHETLQPAWSPGGMLTFYDRTLQAFVVSNLQTGEQYRFANQTGEPGSWHPDGLQYAAPEILFYDETVSQSVQDLQAVASSHLIVFNWQSGSAQDLTPGMDLEDTAPSYSPDGKYLAFTRKYLDIQRWTPGRQIWILHLPSQQAQQMTDDPDYNHFDLRWSPAGDQLAFVRFNQTEPTNPPELWLMDPLTGRTILIATAGFSPQWIP
jgi:Tol biopolymer transport system component